MACFPTVELTVLVERAFEGLRETTVAPSASSTSFGLEPERMLSGSAESQQPSRPGLDLGVRL